jgi:poly(hydroxyalkanoate) granule-associated protein
MATTASRRSKTPRSASTLQEDLKHTAERAWKAGKSALETLGETIEAKQPELRRMGEKGLAYAKDTVEEASTQARRYAGQARRGIESVVDKQVAAALDRFGVPSKDEIRSLSRRVADLTAKVEKLTATRRK